MFLSFDFMFVICLAFDGCDISFLVIFLILFVELKVIKQDCLFIFLLLIV